jgi:RHS repeat-associated protein
LYHANSTTTGDDASGYDPLDRLTDFQRGTLSSSGHNGSTLDTVTTINGSGAIAQQSFNLDAQGNLGTILTGGGNYTNTATYNAQNELVHAEPDGRDRAYDNNGNMLQDFDRSDAYVYDAWNELVSETTGDGTFVCTFDALGRRISENAGDAATRDDYWFDFKGNVVEDDHYREGVSQADRQQFVWGQAYVNELILRDRDADDSDDTGGYGADGNRLEERIYANFDANHNVTSIAAPSADGSALERFIYSADGLSAVYDNGMISMPDAYAWQFRYQNEEMDQHTGLYHMGAREYDPDLGRWMQQEPFGAL